MEAVKDHAIRLYRKLGYTRAGEPIVKHWWKVRDDGSRERVIELSHVMAKKISSDARATERRSKC